MEKLMANSVNPNIKGLYRAGSVSAIVLFVSYIIITVAYVRGGALPSGAEEWLRYLAGHTVAWWIILGLSVLTDFLFVPIALSLYFSLKEVNRNAILAGTGFLGFFVVLDLAITWPNYSSLIILSRKYAATTNDAQRVDFVAAAIYAYSVLTSNLLAVYIILIPALGILIISLVMLKGIFKKVTAYLGVVTGILGIVAVVGGFFTSSLGLAVVITSVLTTFWILFVGYGLFRLSKK
jgi:hypothetical protein